MNRFGISLVLGVAIVCPTFSRNGRQYVVSSGRMLDVRSGRVLLNQGILIGSDRIITVGPFGEISKQVVFPTVIELSSATVLPGFADCHVHVFLQGDITSADYDEHLLKEPIPYRTIRATVAARTALLNGFTALHDVETEDAMYADVDVKTAINR